MVDKNTSKSVPYIVGIKFYKVVTQTAKDSPPNLSFTLVSLGFRPLKSSLSVVLGGNWVTSFVVCSFNCKQNRAWKLKQACCGHSKPLRIRRSYIELQAQRSLSNALICFISGTVVSGRRIISTYFYLILLDVQSQRVPRGYHPLGNFVARQ
jgi:hypothetical protein